jgi:hypothetical protein
MFGASRVRHADEVEPDHRFRDLERFGSQLVQLLRIGAARWVMTRNSRLTKRYGPIGWAGLMGGIAKARGLTSLSLMSNFSLVVAHNDLGPTEDSLSVVI